MRISSTFSNRKIGQRMALLLAIAAIIPALLMTLLSNQKFNQLVTNYEHKLLVEKSRNYALSTFSNLVFARNRLEHLIQTSENHQDIEDLFINFTQQNILMFQSVTTVTNDGEIINGESDKHIPIEALQNLAKLKANKSTLMIWPSSKKGTPPEINLILQHVSNTKAPTLFIAKINPHYLWGKKQDYPSNMSLCAYQLNKHLKTKLFCSTEPNESTNNQESSALNSGAWELFLAGEFQSKPWLFETNRLLPMSPSDLKTVINSKAYIGITLLSLLIVGLLSLIQIRKTMVPLEQLVSGTKKIAEGNFSTIKISGESEFSDLADAFNSMSSHIKQQLTTLQSFSSIDREIASKIDVELIIDLVMKRMQVLKPDGLFCIACLEEESTSEMQFNCTIAGYESLPTMRLPILTIEVNAIQSYGKGQIKRSHLDSDFAHERLMAELGTLHLWTFPIFWQGELCAFLSVGSKEKFDANDAHWKEFRELASRVATVISARTREQKLLLEAQYDNLTGLPNRILLQDRLQMAIDHADQTNTPLWVVFLDLDRFKYVNDSLGHVAGDNLLKEIGNRLQLETREVDTVARFGGDEFVIVLSGDAGEDIQISVLNRIMVSIGEPIHINGQELVNTCSIGVSVYPNDGKNAENLIKNADIAMYRAKELGKNNYQFFTARLNEKAAERMQMITLLHKAIDQDEFALHYQPKVDLITNDIVGMEALIRWNNPTLGQVSPAQFIPVAEDAGLIITIGEWVLRTACEQLATWQKHGISKLLMSVNISARQFQHDNLVETIKSILIETGLKAECLELELTESLLMTNANQAISKLHEIKAMGIQLSIDDFGTGYSNLSYLDKLPIDTLKIDKVFIDSITLNTEKTPIVNTIINLAKNMNMKVVAEGVELAEQVYYLKNQKCDEIQGYYFSRPLAAPAIKEMLMSGKKLEPAKLTSVENTKK